VSAASQDSPGRAYDAAVETAREYYNSEDADNFYFHVWGGEDIHIGLYEGPDDEIAEASRRTVARMAEAVATRPAGTRVLDLGAGYGGAARYLAQRFGWHVTALNLSEAENARNRDMTSARGLGELVDVVDGSFEAIASDDASFDLVWSQDALLHSGDRARVLAEAARVLKAGGELLFTDPMQADDCPEGVLQPVLDRIHLSSLGSLGFYRAQARALGLEDLGFTDLTPHLVAHYDRVRRVLEAQREELMDRVSAGYMDRMDTGLGHWVDAGESGYLKWGILHFRKA